jgi:hypothetical protein
MYRTTGRRAQALTESRTFPRKHQAGYSSGMSGAHRSTTQTSPASVRKSAFWLLQLTGAAAAVLVQLALLAFIGYTLITQPSKA